MHTKRHLSARYALVLACGLMMVLKSYAAAEYTLNGLGNYSAFSGKNNDYAVALHTRKPASDVKSILNNPLRLEIIITSPTFLSVMLRKEWYESVLVNSSNSILERYLERVDNMLNSLKIPIVQNDVIVFEYDYSQPVRLKLNEETLWEFDKKDFFYMMLAPWFGSIPLSNQLKTQLLSAGKGGIDARYSNLTRNANNQLSKEQKLAIKRYREIELVSPEPLIATPLPLTIAPIGSPVPITEKALGEVVELSKVPTDMPSSEPAPQDQAALNRARQAAQAQKERLEEARFKQQIQRFRKYIDDVRRSTTQHVVYPPLAVRRNQEGTVVVQVVIDSFGRASDPSVVKSSKSRILDLSALKAVTQSSPFPSIPDDLDREDVSLLIPISFSLSDI